MRRDDDDTGLVATTSRVTGAAATDDKHVSAKMRDVRRSVASRVYHGRLINIHEGDWLIYSYLQVDVFEARTGDYLITYLRR